MENDMQASEQASERSAAAEPPAESRSAVTIQARWRGVQARQEYWVQLEAEAERLEREMSLVEAEIANENVPPEVAEAQEATPTGCEGDPSPPVEATLGGEPHSQGIQCTFDKPGSLGIGFGCQGVEGPVYITKIKGGSPAAQQLQLSPGLVLAAVQVSAGNTRLALWIDGLSAPAVLGAHSSSSFDLCFRGKQ
jgi:hypothetical protein